MPNRPRPSRAARRPPNGPPGDPPALADLRQKVLGASEMLINQEGVGALSMREVARRAGVTHQAPYHHFANKEAIIAELVARGFRTLQRRLAQARKKIAADKASALNAACMAYADFALDHPGIFRIMCRPEICDITQFPDASQACNEAFDEFLQIIAQIHGRQAPKPLPTLYWALVHGLAALTIDGHLGVHVQGKQARRQHIGAALREFTGRMLAPRDGP